MHRALYPRMRQGLPLLVLATACSGVQPQTALTDGGHRTLSSVVFVPGEHLEWEVKWAGVLVGRVQLAAGQVGEVGGRRALVVRSLAASDGALAVAKRGEMELVTWIDLDRQLPLAQAGSFDAIYSGEVLGTRFGAAAWPRTAWRPTLPGGQVAHSTHSMLGLLRGWRPEAGDRGHVFVRMRWRVLRLDVVAVGRERVRSALGRRSALRIDGAAVPVDGSLQPESGKRSYPISIWIDDEGSGRVPVKIEIESGFGGVVRLDLVTYDPPGEAVAIRAD